ncbi:hypothetical protein V8C86DRAFT_2630186 [Haematococcus lacustris]
MPWVGGAADIGGEACPVGACWVEACLGVAPSPCHEHSQAGGPSSCGQGQQSQGLPRLASRAPAPPSAAWLEGGHCAQGLPVEGACCPCLTQEPGRTQQGGQQEGAPALALAQMQAVPDLPHTPCRQPAPLPLLHSVAQTSGAWHQALCPGLLLQRRWRRQGRGLSPALGPGALGAAAHQGQGCECPWRLRPWRGRGGIGQGWGRQGGGLGGG